VPDLKQPHVGTLEVAPGDRKGRPRRHRPSARVSPTSSPPARHACASASSRILRLSIPASRWKNLAVNELAVIPASLMGHAACCAARKYAGTASAFWHLAHEKRALWRSLHCRSPATRSAHEQPPARRKGSTPDRTAARCLGNSAGWRCGATPNGVHAGAARTTGRPRPTNW
jgi:hypothetical protein